MQYLRVMDAPKAKGSGRVAAVDPAFKEMFPAISAYMTECFLPDGRTARQVSSLLVFCEEGMWKMCLSDRHYGFNMWATAPTYQDCLMDLENRVINDPNGWRKAKTYSGRRK